MLFHLYNVVVLCLNGLVLTKPFNIFNQSFGELLVDFSISTNFSRSAFLDSMISLYKSFCSFIVFMINYSTSPFKSTYWPCFFFFFCTLFILLLTISDRIV